MIDDKADIYTHMPKRLVVYTGASILAIIGVTLTVMIIRAKWINEPYRLGDFVSHKGGFHKQMKRQIYMMFQQKKSIVYRYGYRTKKRWDLAVLSKIADEVMHENDLLPVQFAIHLRLGDVIDNHARSVHGFLHDQEKRVKVGSSCNHKSCPSEGYVQPLSYYHFVASLKPQKIMLISGSHKKTKCPEKSQLYLQVVKGYLESHGHVVTVSWNNDPDLDFAILATAGSLIGSGGNFSTLAQAVNSYRNYYYHSD